MNRTLLPAIAMICCCSSPGAGTPETGPFTFATARAICAPWDGPGISIVLAGDSLAAETPAPPYVEFRIFQSSDRLSGSTVSFSGTTSDSGSVLQCTAAEDCAATDGSLDFDLVSPPRDLMGRYHVLLGGRWLTGSFRARWIARRELCG